MKKKSKILFGLFLALMLPIFFVAAADYLPKNGNDSANMIIDGKKEYKNLYVAGSSILVNNNILGDLYAAGSNINITASIEKDLVVAGSSIILSSDIGDDARIAGSNITIDGPIKGDLVMAGATVNISNTSSVGGDLWVAGGTVNVNAPINGDVKITGGDIYINNSIFGDVELNSRENVTFGKNAQILGEIKHKGNKEAVITNGAQIRAIEFEEMKKKEGKATFGMFSFVKTVSILLAGLLIILLMKSKAKFIVENSTKNFWSSMGIGFIGFMFIPIISLILMITVVGSMIGLIALFWYLFAILLSGVIAMIFLGHIVENIFKKKKIFDPSSDTDITWQTIIWGALAGLVLMIIPVIGWLLIFSIFLVTFGSMLKMVKAKILN